MKASFYSNTFLINRLRYKATNMKLSKMDKSSNFSQSIYCRFYIISRQTIYNLRSLEGIGIFDGGQGFFFCKKIRDHDSHEITVEELVGRYYKDPDKYFKFTWIRTCYSFVIITIFTIATISIMF
jgi:hypothetical protein